MTSIEERLAVAYGLIRHKRYAEARAILKKLKHPKAREWLEKLDEVDGTKQRRASRLAVITNTIGWTIVVISLAFVALVVFLLIYSAINRDANTSQARLLTYCFDVYRETDNIEWMSGCSEWMTDVFPIHWEEIIACHRQSPELDAPFSDCLIAEDILPPGIIPR